MKRYFLNSIFLICTLSVSAAIVLAANHTSLMHLKIIGGPPYRPILNSPAPNATSSATSTVFYMTATDPDGNNIQYKQQIFYNEACTDVLQTNTQASSQTGWSGQNASSTKEYASDNTGVFTLQTALATGTYWWGATAIDPEDSNRSSPGPSTATSTGSWQTNPTPVSPAVGDFSAATWNGYAYILGGNVYGAATATVYYASINPDGTIGSWTMTTPLPNVIYGGSAVAWNGYLYSVMGDPVGGVSETSTVYYAKLNSDGTVASPWNSSQTPGAIRYGAAAVWNGYLYAFGGEDPSNFTSTVYYAPLDPSTGAPETWSVSANHIPTRIGLHSGLAYNGYLHVLGGINSSGLNTSSTYFAPINTNGDVGAWTSTTRMPYVDAQYPIVGVYNGYLYVAGGNASSTWASGGDGNVSTTIYAPLSTSGTIGSWSYISPLPGALSDGSGFMNNGYLYSISGYTDSDVNTTTIFYSRMNVQGSTDASDGWRNLNALPTSTYDQGVVTYNGYLYSLGGSNSNGSIKGTAYYAKINSSGTVGSWGAGDLPHVNTSFAVTSYGGYIYVLGGNVGGGVVTTTVAYTSSTTAGDGTLNSWSTTTPLPSSTQWSAAVGYNNHLYLIGGRDNAYNATSAVLYASVNATGSLGAWQTTSPLPASRYLTQAVAYNGYIYLAGGRSGSPYSTVYYAPVYSNGTLGTWQQTASLPSALVYLSVVQYNGFIYIVGGSSDSTNGTTSVLYAQILPSAAGSGTISAWHAATALPSRLDYGRYAVAYDGYLFTAGGATGTVSASATSTVQSIGLLTSCTAFTTTSTTVSNYAPQVSGVSLNHGNAMVLTANATTTFDINYTVSDQDGCTDIINTTSTAFRTGVSSTCAVANPTTDDQNCYLTITDTTSSCSGNSFNVTDTVDVWYFADSTGNPSSSYPSQHWEAYASAIDASNASNASTSPTLDVNVLTAIDVSPTSTSYGMLTAGQNTSSTNHLEHVENAGNSPTTLQISGTAMTSGPNSLATSSQHYATTSFTFGGGEQQLSGTATTVSGFSLAMPTSTAAVSSTIYWGITAPSGSATGTYQSTITYTANFSSGGGYATITDIGDATTTGTGTSVSITPGFTIPSGDVVVASIHANANGNTITDNNGSYAFTDTLQQDTSDTSRFAIMERVAGAAETSTYSWTLASSQNWSIILRVFSGVDTSTIWDVQPSATTTLGDVSNTTSTATAPSITINTPGAMGIAQYYTDSPTVTYSTVDNGYGNQVQPNALQAQSSYIRTWSATGATGSTHATYSALNDYAAVQFALKPSPL